MHNVRKGKERLVGMREQGKKMQIARVGTTPSFRSCRSSTQKIDAQRKDTKKDGKCRLLGGVILRTFTKVSKLWSQRGKMHLSYSSRYDRFASCSREEPLSLAKSSI